jgi:hypothetical protein
MIIIKRYLVRYIEEIESHYATSTILELELKLIQYAEKVSLFNMSIQIERRVKIKENEFEE